MFAEMPGKPFLHHFSRTWLLDDDGNRGAAAGAGDRLLAAGGRRQPRGAARPPDRLRRDLARRRPTARRSSCSTDVVARTETAKDYTAGHRLYGLVDGELLWAFDMAAVGQPLQPHLSATLRRA